MWDVYVFGSVRRRQRGGEWMRGLCLGFTNPVGTGGVLDVCLCFCCGGAHVRGVGGVGWVGVLDQEGAVVSCLCDL